MRKTSPLVFAELRRFHEKGEALKQRPGECRTAYYMRLKQGGLSTPTGRTFSKITTEAFLAVIDRVHSNKEAADLLGVTPPVINYRCKVLGLTTPSKRHGLTGRFQKKGI